MFRPLGAVSPNRNTVRVPRNSGSLPDARGTCAEIWLHRAVREAGASTLCSYGCGKQHTTFVLHQNRPQSQATK